jgi:ABC-type nitrate/sulfonate/bicarbonate transport system substrate-binding protein
LVPFQGFVTTEKKLAENPGEIKRWLRAMVRALMFLRARPEEAADIAMKRPQLRNISRPMMLDAVKNYIRALPEVIPGLRNAEDIQNIMEYNAKIRSKSRAFRSREDHGL